MAFQVPQQPRDPRVVLPAAPANPPVLANLYAAEKYKNVVLRSAGDLLCRCTSIHHVVLTDHAL
jgi:hypothetical protein